MKRCDPKLTRSDDGKKKKCRKLEKFTKFWKLFEAETVRGACVCQSEIITTGYAAATSVPYIKGRLRCSAPAPLRTSRAADLFSGANRLRTWQAAPFPFEIGPQLFQSNCTAHRKWTTRHLQFLRLRRAALKKNEIIGRRRRC